MRNTKIVATLGPASDSPATIRQLLEAGVDVFRLNASHGTIEEHAGRIQTVRALSAEMKQQVGILLDLQGPKIRLGRFEGGGCVLKEGELFTITTEEVMGNSQVASTSYKDFARDVKAGDRVLVADGTIHLRVVESDGTAARCVVVSGGPVGDRKGINLPGVEVSTPSLTKKDRADLCAGIEAGVDMVALSFVRKRDDMIRVRLYLEEHEARLPVVAKIEKPEGWTNFDEILEESDGVMVARGDLGVEMALEKVPRIQKSIIERARMRGRFAITATQMLESMVESPLPTRAEVSDVANAIYDGTDAVMLSAETSTGRYPVEAARIMARIANEAEATLDGPQYRDPPHSVRPTHPDIIADAAYRAARTLGARAIAVFTSSGASARLVARYRPPVPIYAFTPSTATARQLSVIYGLKPVELPQLGSTDDMIAAMSRILKDCGCVQAGDSVVVMSGQPVGKPGSTNILKLHHVG